MRRQTHDEQVMTDQGKRPMRHVLALFLFLVCPQPCFASRQDEVLNSINQSVGQTVDPKMLLGVVLAVVALIGVIIAGNYLRKRTVISKPLNHSGRLLKEISSAFNLRPVEVRQLKALADAQELSSPLLLLLCPSLLNKAVKDRSGVDRELVGRIARKFAQNKA